ncbi:MAG: hypothetical protein ACI82I_003555, partial [Gammaproteobacteria bacterium]
QGSNPCVSANTSYIMTYSQTLTALPALQALHFIRNFDFEGLSIPTTRISSLICECVFGGQAVSPQSGGEIDIK